MKSDCCGAEALLIYRDANIDSYECDECEKPCKPTEPSSEAEQLGKLQEEVEYWKAKAKAENEAYLDIVERYEQFKRRLGVRE